MTDYSELMKEENSLHVDSTTVLPEVYQLLREAARKATPGPWILWDDGDVGTGYPVTKILRNGTTRELESEHIANTDERDGNYIALADPTTILALIERLEYLENLFSENRGKST